MKIDPIFISMANASGGFGRDALQARGVPRVHQRHDSQDPGAG